MKVFGLTYSCRRLIKITVLAERKVTVNGSLFLFIFQFGDIMDDRSDRGSTDHANRVMTAAKDHLSKLSSKNTFKPIVLARVSHTGRSFIGASIAVSHFLRPICLYHRIKNLKQSLGKATVHFKPLNIPDRDNWIFEAFHRKKYDSEKNLCQNCKIMFRGNRSENGETSFLAACAEYCAVNQLLPDELNLCQSDDQLVADRLKRNLARCSDLFESFSCMSKKCIDAADSGNKDDIEVVYQEVISRLHIFGLSPECNPNF